MRDTDQDWATIANTDPYWGVLSADEFRGHTVSTDVKDKFYRSGEDYVASLFAEISAFKPGFSPVRALDFGCGLGRLLFPMASRCAEAVGVDIAPRMLQLAAAYAAEKSITNAELVLGDDALSRVQGGFDLIHSFIVLQHIPVARGMAILRRLLGLLSPGGIFAFQVTFAKRRELMIHEGPVARYYRRVGDVMHDLGANPSPGEGTVSMYDYDLNDICAVLSEFTARPMSLRLLPDSHLSVFVIGTVG